MKKFLCVVIALCVLAGSSGAALAQSKCEEQLNECATLGMSTALEAGMIIEELNRQNQELEAALKKSLAQSIILIMMVEELKSGGDCKDMLLKDDGPKS
ncbi:hypothetical protein ACFL08_05050 [Patescibacteria group bacterium]